MGLRPTRYACGTRGSRWSWADCLGILIYAGELLAFPQSAPEQERFVEGVWIGLSLVIVGSTGLREGQRWAWYLAVRFVVWAAVYEAYRGQVVFLIFTAIAVILGVRKFFPKTGSASSSDRD